MYSHLDQLFIGKKDTMHISTMLWGLIQPIKYLKTLREKTT